MIDAHHHLWDLSARQYRWLDGGQPWASDAELARLRRSFLVADLAPLAAAAGVTATVVIQTVTEPWETPDLLALAAAGGGLPAVVVGWTDLTRPGVADAVAALRAGPGGGALRGIRHPLPGEPDPDWLARPAVRRGLRALGAAGLSFDIMAVPDQLPAAVAAARAVPELTFVLDHLGVPPVGSAGSPAGSPWAAAVRDLAALPTVACKLSGAHGGAADAAAAGGAGGGTGDGTGDGGGLSAEALRPYYETVLSAFGPGRLLFGSDWPVSALTAPYGAVHDLYRELTAQLSPAERDAVFGGTARCVYRLLLP